jgi:hypothetical protein
VRAADAATGKAKVKISFPAWKAGRVAPAVIDLAMVGESAPKRDKTDEKKTKRGRKEGSEKKDG